MLAKCRHVSGATLVPPANGTFYTPRSEFHVTLDKHYYIAGLGIFEHVPLVLIRDDTEGPNWLPLAAFDVPAQSTPAHWEFVAEIAELANSGWTARWGYPRLVRELAHVEALIERNPEALAIFHDEVERGIAGPQSRS
jgi:hypothetical protein